MLKLTEIRIRFGLAAIVCLSAFLAQPSATAEDCHDRDGDGYWGGIDCLPATDCNDDDPLIHPGAIEVCNGIDDNCDGQIDEGCVRICAQPQLFKVPKKLTIPGNAHATSALIGQFPAGPALAMESGNFPGGAYLDILEYAQGFDPSRVPWTAAVTVGDGTVVHPYELGQQIAVGGERMLIAYQDRSAHDQQKAKTYVRVVDRLGHPVHPEPLALLPTIPRAEYPWLYHSPAWDGESFALFWSAAPWGNELLLSRVGYDSSLSPDPTKVVIGDVDGRQSQIQEIAVVWTGSAFLAAVTTDPPGLVILKISRDGRLVASHSFSEKYVSLPRLIRTGDRLALAYVSSESADQTIFLKLGFLDLDGNLLGQGWTLLDHESISQLVNLQLAWTGGAVGVLFTGSWDVGPAYPMRWRFWQVRPDGTVVSPGMVILAEGGQTFAGTSLAWTGTEFQMIGTRKDNTAHWERIICSCTDNDHDGFDTCTGRDNDDDNPLVHPGAKEICRGGADEDGDGLFDCEDPDCPAPPGPGDVQGLSWNRAGLSWEAAAGAEVYDLARGLMSDFFRRHDWGLGDCPARSRPETTWNDDGRKPPVGDALWYLVRAEGAACARSSWGAAEQPRVVSACH